MSDGTDTALIINKMFDIECSADEAIELEQQLFQRMTNRIAELEQALEFYAAHESYCIDLGRMETCIAVAVDNGEIAREALGRGEKEITKDFAEYIHSKNVEIDRLKVELEAAITTANDNYQVILKCNAQINELKRQLAETGAEIERLKQVAHNQHEYHQSVMSAAHSNNEELRAELEAATKQKSDWHNMYQETYDELSSVQQAILVETERIKAAWREIATLQRQLAEARAEVAELKDFKKALERIANTPDDYEMEYCRNIAIIALEELI